MDEDDEGASGIAGAAAGSAAVRGGADRHQEAPGHASVREAKSC